MELLLLMAAGFACGTLGALVGIGGGVLLVPLLVGVFGVPMGQAVPASLMCVVASSCGAAASYVEERLSDVRLALTLDVATVAGAIGGGLVSGRIPPPFLALAFGGFALLLSFQLVLGRRRAERSVSGPTNYPLGISGSFLAGGVSALLGVGGGPIKVPTMSLGMGVPFKVASATSNLMIGITAAASVSAYAWRGQLNMSLVSPLVVGVLAGAFAGSRAMARLKARSLERLFALVLLAIAAQMLWKGGRSLWP